MKTKFFLFAICTFILVSCNPIPNKSITEKLDAKELSNIIKKDTAFASFYKYFQESITPCFDDELVKAKFVDITYRQLYGYVKFLNDTAYWNPIMDNIESDWNSKYGNIQQRVDSTIAYWNKYMEDNSLDRFVKVELGNIKVKYYSYIGGVDDAYMGFRITPLQGKIEQMTFDYSYGAKIYDILPYSHSCILTSPVSKSEIDYWEIDYSEKNKFDGMTTAKFLRDYNINIVIKSVRKDGINYSQDNGVPESVKKYLRWEKIKDEGNSNIYDDDVIKECIDSNYIEKWKYKFEEREKIEKGKDELCYQVFQLPLSRL